MRKRLNILTDMDDTIEYLLDAWLNWLNERYGTCVKASDVTEWDLSKSFPELSKEQIGEPLFIPDFWDTVKPRKDAIEYLGRLHDEGCNIYVVTASHYKTINDKMERVLLNHFPFISWKNVIVADFKQMINGDVMIDDAQHNLIGGSYEKILMDAPYNKNFNNELFGIKREFCWRRIYATIHERFRE